MKRKKELLINTLILGIGQFVPKIIALVTLPILTGYLTKSDYGIYDLFLAIQSLILPLITLQVQQGLFRKLISAKGQDKSTHISCAVFFVIFSSLFWAPIIFIIMFLVGNFDVALILLVLCLYIANSFYDLFGQVVRGFGNNKAFSIATTIYSVSNMLALILFWLQKSLSLYSVLFSMIFSYVLAIVYLVVTSNTIKYVHFRFCNRKTLRDLLSYSIPIIPSSISLWIVNLSDRLLVTFFLGTGMNAVYAVANKIPNLFAAAYGVFNLAWTESASRAKEDDADPITYYSDMTNSLWRFMTGVILLLIAMTPYVFILLIDTQYESAFHQIPILYWGVYLSSFVSFYGGIYIAYSKTKSVGFSSALGAVINIGVNLLCISSIGLYAASISTVISFAIILIYRMCDTRKMIRIKYDINIMVISLCVVLATSILCFFRLPLFNAINCVIALAYNLVFNRSIVTGVIKKVKSNR